MLIGGENIKLSLGSCFFKKSFDEIKNLNFFAKKWITFERMNIFS